MTYKKIYLIISVVVLIPGLFSLIFNGLNLSIDFTGGSVLEYKINYGEVSKDDLSQVLEDQGVTIEAISFSQNKIFIKAKSIEPEKNTQIKTTVEAIFANISQVSFETVGPAIGQETTKNAFVALAWASIAILFYIAYVFRNIPKPYSSFRFGASAIIAMLHDAFLVLGIFSILGYFFNTEVDGLFITAILTVIGFSVHDTIVVFDRIRENLSKLPKNMGFESIVNYSVVETLGRSLATSLTVLITLFSLYVLGGESIRTFVLAMLIGIASGTYSSIFTASPILVLWEGRGSPRQG